MTENTFDKIVIEGEILLNLPVPLLVFHQSSATKIFLLAKVPPHRQPWAEATHIVKKHKELDKFAFSN